MDLKRFFCEDTIEGDDVFLRGEEYFHAVKVTRHKVGYKLIVCDGSPYDYLATVSEITSTYLRAHIDDKRQNDAENDFFTTLYIGNNKHLDEVVQKAVEMGVNQVVPFFSQHCNEKDVNPERLRKIVMESSKQCGRTRLCSVSDAIAFSEMLRLLSPDNTFAFYEYERLREVSSAKTNGAFVNIVVGCEGGFSSEEIQAMHDRGIATYSLGKRILRVPTAVIAACALVNDVMRKV